MIPKLIHWVWVGPKPVPDKVRRLVDGWRALNPDYEIVLWNEANIDFSYRFVQAAYGVRAWNRISDFVRMWALARHGGIYLDTDIELRRPLDPLLNESCFLGFQLEERHPDWVNGAVLGAEPNHWFIQRLHRYFVERMHGWEEVGSFYGPGLITKLLLEEGLQQYSDEPQKVRDITIFPRRHFYPYSWTETFSESCVTPDTFAIHHWDESWAKGRSIPDRARRAILRLSAQVSPSLACRNTRAWVERKRRDAATA